MTGLGKTAVGRAGGVGRGGGIVMFVVCCVFHGNRKRGGGGMTDVWKVGRNDTDRKIVGYDEC